MLAMPIDFNGFGDIKVPPIITCSTHLSRKYIPCWNIPCWFLTLATHLWNPSILVLTFNLSTRFDFLNSSKFQHLEMCLANLTQQLATLIGVSPLQWMHGKLPYWIIQFSIHQTFSFWLYSFLHMSKLTTFACTLHSRLPFQIFV